MYATFSSTPPSPNASTTGPRAIVSTIMIASPPSVTAAAERARPERLIIPDRIGCGAYSARG